MTVDYPSPRKAVITTERTAGFTGKYVYVLFKRDSKWLVDKKKRYDFEGKLKQELL